MLAFGNNLCFSKRKYFPTYIPIFVTLNILDITSIGLHPKRNYSNAFWVSALTLITSNDINKIHNPLNPWMIEVDRYVSPQMSSSGSMAVGWLGWGFPSGSNCRIGTIGVFKKNRDGLISKNRKPFFNYSNVKYFPLANPTGTLFGFLTSPEVAAFGKLWNGEALAYSSLTLRGDSPMWFL